MDAVILAAGSGSRIREYHDLPKGFLQIGGESLILQTIKILQYYGINRILIVTGYKADYYINLFAKNSMVELVYNSEYETTDSLYSWYLAKKWIGNDFLLLESDLLFPESAVGAILSSKYSNDVLLSGETLSGDEVYVETKDDIFVTSNKRKNELDHVSGELIGVSKFSASFYKSLLILLECNMEQYKHYHYEEILEIMTKEDPIYCTKINELLWSEVDDIEQLNRAKNLYNQIRENSKIFSPYEGLQ